MEPAARRCEIPAACGRSMRVIRGGRFLTGEQSLRLAIADSVDREKLLKAIIEEMRQQAKEAERRGPKR